MHRIFGNSNGGVEFEACRDNYRYCHCRDVRNECLGAFAGEYGIGGGWFAGFAIIGTMWFMNHWIGLINNDGAL